MITIKIKNAQQIIESQRGWFVARMAPHFIDVQKKVEEEVVKRLESIFVEKGIDAEISVLKGE